MINPFASIESSINNACIGALANVAVTLPSSAVIRGIFDAAYADPLGMAGNTPQLRVSTSDVSSVATGQVLTVEATSYTVVGIEPDGTGISTLILRRA